MRRMQEGRMRGTPASMSPLFGFGMAANALDRISKMMQEYSANNRIEGMSSPDAYMAAVNMAQVGMKLGGLGGARLMQKFINDHYQYTVHPAIRSIGKAGGKYGSILESYIQAKSDIKKSYGDIGATIGQGLAFGLAFFAKGLRLTSIAAAGTGIGIPAAAIGLAASFVVEAVASMILPWIGRKIAEAVVEKTGYVDKMSKATLGQGIMNTLPEGFYHFKSVASSVVGQKWYNKDDSYASYFSTMQRLATTKVDGISMRNLGISTRETGSMYSEISKNLNINNENLGTYTRTLGILRGITGEDFTGTFASISQGSAMSSTDIDATASSFQLYFDAVSKGGKQVNKAALNLTRSLAEAADGYAKRNIAVKDVPMLFSGMQKFVQKNMQPEGKQDTSEASDIIGILNNIAGDYGNSPLASQISNFAGISRANAKRGLDSDGISRISMAISGKYHFGNDSSIDKKTGTMKLGRKGENTFAQMYLDFTRSQEQGGLGLSDENSQQLIKYILAYQTSSEGLTFSRDSKNPLSSTITALNGEALLKLGDVQVQITDRYESLTGIFSKDFITLSDTVLLTTTQMTEQIAKGALDLLRVTKQIVNQGSSGGGAVVSGGSGKTGGAVVSGGTGGTGGTITGYGTPTRTAGSSVIGTKDLLIAHAGFKEQIAPAAAKAGLELKTLYAFLGAESTFGTNVKNYAGMDYVGVGQIGVAAMIDMNKLHNTNLDRMKTADNIMLAAYYADYLRDRYVKMKQNSFKGYNFDPNDPRVIYIAYNWGMGNLDNHIRQWGGINWEKLPDETQIGVRNVERAAKGFDAVQGAPIYSVPSGVVGAPVSPSSLTRVVANYRGGVTRGINDGSYRSSTALLYNMSGASTERGRTIADKAEMLLATGGRSMYSATYDFYGMCAAVAGKVLESAGVRNRAVGNADVQRDIWKGRGMTLTLDEVARTGGFQPGDLVYFADGQHVAIVSHDGSLIQAGYAKDERGSSLVRTDATTFGSKGSNAIVVRVSADTNNDGRMSDDEREALFKVVPAAIKKTQAIKKVSKTIKGKEVLVNALVNGNDGTFSVKNLSGTGLSKGQVAKIKKQEAAIEKALGLKADQLEFETQAVSGGSVLRIRIDAPLDDVGKVSQDIIKIIERII